MHCPRVPPNCVVLWRLPDAIGNSGLYFVAQWMSMRFPDGAGAVSPFNHDRVAVIGPALQQGQRHPALFVTYWHTIHRRNP